MVVSKHSRGPLSWGVTGIYCLPSPVTHPTMRISRDLSPPGPVWLPSVAGFLSVSRGRDRPAFTHREQAEAGSSESLLSFFTPDVSAELWTGGLGWRQFYHSSLQPMIHCQVYLREMLLLLQRPPQESERLSPGTGHGAAGQASHPLLCNPRGPGFAR